MIHFLFHRSWGPWQRVAVSMDEFSAGNYDYYKNRTSVLARKCTKCPRKQMKHG